MFIEKTQITPTMVILVISMEMTMDIKKKGNQETHTMNLVYISWSKGMRTKRIVLYNVSADSYYELVDKTVRSYKENKGAQVTFT